MLNLFKTTTVILATLVFGVAVSGCVKKPALQPNVNQPVNQNVNVNQNTNTTTSTTQIDTTNWKTYRNDEYGFEFKYPGYLIVNEASTEIKFVNLSTEMQEIVVTFYNTTSTEQALRQAQYIIDDRSAIEEMNKNSYQRGVTTIDGHFVNYWVVGDSYRVAIYPVAFKNITAIFRVVPTKRMSTQDFINTIKID